MIIQPLRKAPRGRGSGGGKVSGFCYEALWGGGRSLKRFFLVPFIVSFHVRKSYMSHANLCLKISLKKKKPVCPRFYWNLTSTISVYCRSNVKSHAGWSIFLCDLSENECSGHILENFRKYKIYRQ